MPTPAACEEDSAPSPAFPGLADVVVVVAALVVVVTGTVVLAMMVPLVIGTGVVMLAAGVVMLVTGIGGSVVAGVGAASVMLAQPIRAPLSS